MLYVTLGLLAFQGMATTPLELEAKPWVDCGAPLRDLALDPRGLQAYTLTGTGVLAAHGIADGKQVWRREGLRLVAIDCTTKAVLGTDPFPSSLRFSPETGEQETNNGFPDEGAADLVADPGGRWVWIGTANGLVRLVPGDPQTYSRRPLQNGGVSRLALDDDGKLLAAGGSDGSVRFANAQGADVDEKRVLKGPASPVTALAFASRLLIVAHADNSLRLWGLSGNKVKLELPSGTTPVHAVAVNEPAGWFATGDAEGNVLVRSLAKDLVLARAKSGSGAISALAFAPKQKTLFAASGPKVVTLDLAALK